MAHFIYYGKGNVAVYRTHATPLTDVTPIPESSFTGRSNTLFAAAVDVQVYGDNFLPAYTDGDNRNVVPTDTMNNFILRETLTYPGATLEGLLGFLGDRFLTTYAQMETLKMTGREIPFPAAQVQGGTASDVLFSAGRGDYATAELHLERAPGGGVTITDHRCGLEKMQPVKITGNAFANFAADEYTTLPERTDRLLYIYLDCFWKYSDPAVLLSDDYRQYVPAEQVRDLLMSTFHEFVNMSIQHLIYEMAQRMLARFPQLVEVAFDGQNRLWIPVAESDQDPRVKTYRDPTPPYGALGLVLRRD